MSPAPVRRIYFDNAATSFPKPPGVAHAMLHMLTEIGAPARGLYAEARQAAHVIALCRQRIATLVNLVDDHHHALAPSNVVFGYNTSDALNLAIKGAYLHARRTRSPGAPLHVVSTAMEHNSVLRPMHALMAADPALSWSIVPADPLTSLVSPADIAAAVRPNRSTFAVIVNHASNVTGAVQDLRDISRALSTLPDRPLFIVDGAQSLGHIPVNMPDMGIDLLAFPGHKGLLGPTGTGGLCIRPSVESRLDTLREGGTGNVSEEQFHPLMLPEKYEAGSHNTVGIAGLSEGLAYILSRGVEALRQHERSLMVRMLERLDSPALKSFRLLGTRSLDHRVGVFSLAHESIPPAELAAILESAFGILTRPGLHCAPIAHETCGTLSPDTPASHRGACRLSFGPFLSLADIDVACDALAEIASTPALTSPTPPLACATR